MVVPLLRRRNPLLELGLGRTPLIIWVRLLVGRRCLLQLRPVDGRTATQERTHRHQRYRLGSLSGNLIVWQLRLPGNRCVLLVDTRGAF